MSPEAFGDWQTAAVGFWALGSVALLPRAFTWKSPWGDDDVEAGPAFAFDWLIIALMWPVVPVAIAALLASTLVMFLLFGVPYFVRKWWSADWSARP